MTYHAVGGSSVWNESAHYRFTADEIDVLADAAESIHAMCLEAVEKIITDGMFDVLDIPPAFRGWVEESWRRGDPSLYGRFDLAYNGVSPPRLLEYNADTPTSLVESAVAQWFWLKDVFPAMDQFNSLHEALIERWPVVAPGGAVGLTSMADEEDAMTCAYLCETAIRAGLGARWFPIDRLGWNAATRTFRDAGDAILDACFRLYPWEWMFADEFGGSLPLAPTRWIEPPWKCLLSTKAILPVLWAMFPDSPHLLEASFDPLAGDAVRKPFRSRESANIALIRDGAIRLETDGPYTGPVIFQRAAPLASFAGRRPVLGVWMVGEEACGLGIREESGEITTNLSPFVPHLFEPASAAGGPVGPSFEGDAS